MSEPEDTVGVWRVEVTKNNRVRFHIDHQSFTLKFIGGDKDITDREHAEWLAKQLRIALARLDCADAIREAVLAEREACAKVCDIEADDIWSTTKGMRAKIRGCASAIRARGAA